MRASVSAVVVAVLLVGMGVPAFGLPYNGEVLADSPVRYYRLGEAVGPAAADASTYNAPGTYVNVAPGDFSKPGALLADTDTSVWLSGANTQVTGADAAELRITGDIAVEFWYRKTSEAGDWQRIVGKGDGTHRNYGIWEPGGADGRLLFQQYSNGAAVLNFTSATNIPTNVWTHVAAVVEGGAASLYINGILDATSTRSGPPSTSADPLRIGYGQMHTYFPGYVDEVAVYNHGLSADRVRDHFEARINKPTYEQLIPYDGANAFYRFDDASSADGATAADSADSNPATYRGNIALVSGFPGFSGTAASFDGTTSYLKLPTAPFGAYPTGGGTNQYNLSFETWFQTTDEGVILGQTAAGTTPGVGGAGGWVPAVYVDTAGQVRTSMFWHNGTGNQIVSPLTYNDGEWHHLVDVYRNGTEFLYLDGTLVGQQLQNEFGYSGAYDYYLGTGYAAGAWTATNGGWFFFSGNLDETALYPYSLSEAQIAQHYLVAWAAVPEPTTLSLLALGALGLLRRRRRR